MYIYCYSTPRCTSVPIYNAPKMFFFYEPLNLLRNLYRYDILWKIHKKN